MEEFRNAGQIINVLIDQLSKNSEVIQAPIINPQSKNLFPETVEENMTTYETNMKLSHSTKITSSTDLST